ncbi:acetoacetyl-CoA synthetase [Nocardioides terrae]|uniref:Acetoacetyl-CoA synthetase n=1 Tax=Nocardioides terrae TaxID=574651 RepID=A0A1I1NLL2_9ACTN|nr:acetoacetate--CoA ligase [Nocardioides terrae]SFC98152.1 acetoacetyl-CoA synthetase [Nocardioides terrae]
MWTPSQEQVEATELYAFQTEQGYADYESLRVWSVEHPEEFWRAVWDRYGVVADGDPTTVLASTEMPGAQWFPDVALSFSEHVFRGKADDAVALTHASELREAETWTWGRLRAETARIRAGLRVLGVGRGDRVAAYLPNIPEALAAMLATTSLGAVWSSCSPDFGSSTVLDRFDQIEPTVLLAVDGYRYGGKDFDRRDTVAELAAGLPTVTRTVTLGYLDPAAGDWDEAFPDLAAGDRPLEFERVPFDHPLWILYSSGTSGKPKAIVHGHGGILLESLKITHLHLDAGPDDRVFWFTTTGWMMWNFLVSVLLTDAQIVLYDGNPTAPDPAVLWELAERTGITIFGTSAAYLHGQLKLGVEPTAGRDLSALRAVGSTGSPLSVAGFEWVYDHLGRDVWLFSISGGTDVCSAFVGGVPTLPVHVGELQARALGVALEAWDEDGRPVPPGVVGELVVTRPMPSMPVGFWNDPDGHRYREAYFDHFDTTPPVWRHGDWIELTEHGSAIIHGRSDATINRGGVRMGTAEIYAAVLSVEGVTDALVVDIPDTDPAADSWMPLFVVTDRDLTDAMVAEIRQRVREECSPRHMPNVVVRVPAVPRTLTGKILEVPVKKLFLGADPEKVAARDALANPDAFDWFVDYVNRR